MAEGKSLRVVDKTLIVVVGPTAIGKTAMAINVAKAFNTEIISADSRQFFAEMSIGTAKPTTSELAEVRHHFVDFISIHDEYSAGQFERDALAKIAELHQTHDVVIMAGGSGLYVNAVLYGFDDLPADIEIRKTLMSRLENEGLEVLSNELVALDPESGQRIDLQNTQRVIRALEVCLTSNRTYSSFRKTEAKVRPFKTVIVGLTDERDTIYERINKRVDTMIDAGLVNEVRSLIEHQHINALKTVGYRELFSHFNGECSLEDAIEAIKQNTRRFAKRQITWFKRLDTIRWYSPAEYSAIIPDIKQKIGT